MAPVRPAKRKSDEAALPGTPQRSPIKRRRIGLTLAQKQALIDNLQLEITERARRLRAQYNVQAQQLRSRVEMRVNRIPTALRKAKMGDLLAKHADTQSSRAPRPQYVSGPPPVPAKDGTSPKPIPRKPVVADQVSPRRPHKRPSEGINAADDKENSVEPTAVSKKKARGGPGAADVGTPQLAQVLSPASTNVRVLPRGVEHSSASPAKSSAVKFSSNLLSQAVEKAKGSRGTTDTRKPTGSSTPMTTTKAPGSTIKARKPASPMETTSAPTRGKRKVSGGSVSSDSSTGTVVQKAVASKAKPAPASKRTVMGTIKSATTKKAADPPATASGSTGRTLRKRAA